MINISQYRCDALIITTEKVRIVPLAGITVHEVRQQVSEFLIAVIFLRRCTAAEHAAGCTAQDPRRFGVAVGFDCRSGPSRSRLHWPPRTRQRLAEGLVVSWRTTRIPPLHAAGHHGESSRQSARTAIDRVVSSYIPTVRALSHARGRPPATGHRVLVVSMPQTPGAPDLDGAARRATPHARFPGTLVLAGREADPRPRSY